MAVNTRTIGQLPPRTAIISTDLLEIQADDGLSYHIDVDQLSTFIGAVFLASDNIFTGTNRFDDEIGFFGVGPTTQASALTTADTTTIDSTYDSTEEGVLNNVRTRVNELEAILQAYGLLP